MKKSIRELKNIHKGEDIWLIASGPSMSFVEPSFFENKITLGVNEVYRKYPCDYLVRKEIFALDEIYRSIGNTKLIVSEYDCGGRQKLNELRVDGTYWYFEHRPNEHAKVDLSVIGTDVIVVSYSTITSAMHMAAYLGAKNIILCGHDCTTLDGECNFAGYQKEAFNRPLYESWLEVIEPVTIQVRNKLREVYDCNIYSLNPFVNLRLEGYELGDSPCLPKECKSCHIHSANAKAADTHLDMADGETRNGSEAVTSPAQRSIIQCSIIMPVHNEVEQSRKCLETVIENTPEDIYEMIIVDNASTDGTRSFLRCLEGNIKIITNKTNLGLAIAFNQGAEIADGKYLVFLDQHASLPERWLEEMLGVVREKASIAAVGNTDFLLFRRVVFLQAGMVNPGSTDPMKNEELFERIKKLGYQIDLATDGARA